MKLLIITQAIDKNDPVLGFFGRWVQEFAKHYEFITVICLYKGEYDLPDNVKVLSLGKEEGVSRLGYIIRFYRYIIGERKNYDTVFVHMNHVYVVLGGLFWKIMGKKIGLWYMHKSVTPLLKVAEKLVDHVFTGTTESFRVKSSKVRVLGHGIDSAQFNAIKMTARSADDVFHILTIGRISPVKDYETLFSAVDTLRGEGMKVKAAIVGGPATEEQEVYMNDLKNFVEEKGLENVIEFTGPVPHERIVQYLGAANLFVNMSHTGSLDKVILEAMAAGLPVVTCNEAAGEVLGVYKEEFMFPKGDHSVLADRIKTVERLSREELEKITLYFQDRVKKDHNITTLIEKIITYFKK